MTSLTDDLLDGVPNIAAFINKTPRATYHLIHTNQVPCFKKGGKIYARKSEIEAAFRSEMAV